MADQMPDNRTDDESGDVVRRRAVALRYDEEKDSAPVVTAKGRGLIADRIIELAAEHGVTIYEDHDLVELLLALDIETPIPIELYQAVAHVLAFVYHVNKELPTR